MREREGARRYNQETKLVETIMDDEHGQPIHIHVDISGGQNIATAIAVELDHYRFAAEKRAASLEEAGMVADAEAIRKGLNA